MLSYFILNFLMWANKEAMMKRNWRPEQDREDWKVERETVRLGMLSGPLRSIGWWIRDEWNSSDIGVSYLKADDGYRNTRKKHEANGHLMEIQN